MELDRFNWNVEELIDYKVTIKKQMNYEASKWYQKAGASKKFKM